MLVSSELTFQKAMHAVFSDVNISNVHRRAFERVVQEDLTIMHFVANFEMSDTEPFFYKLVNIW